jgi:hypothetical protein
MAEMRKPQSQSGGMVTGMFKDRDSAERAYQAMSGRGYTRDDINVMMSDEARKRHFAAADARTSELGTKAAEGAGVGAAVGGTLGAALGVAAAVGAVALPGIGLIALGPVAAGLAGAGAGGVTGGLVGALVGSGIPEDRAKLYESGLKQGNILMGVRPRTAEDAEYFEREWKSYRGENIYR